MSALTTRRRHAAQKRSGAAQKRGRRAAPTGYQHKGHLKKNIATGETSQAITHLTISLENFHEYVENFHQ